MGVIMNPNAQKRIGFSHAHWLIAAAAAERQDDLGPGQYFGSPAVNRRKVA